MTPTVTPPVTTRTGRVDFGRPTLRWRNLRIDVISVVTTAVLVLAALVVSIFSLGAGDYDIAPWDVLRAVFGTGAPFDIVVVREWRAPRVLMALILGALLGISGAIFQSLTKNALGSPDVIGFNSGCYFGALVVILFVGAHSSALLAVGAVAGGFATAAIVYLLAFKRGIAGFRLIIVGVAVAIMIEAVNTWMILKANLQVAISAAAWGAGTLANVTNNQVLVVLAGTAVLVVPLAVIARRMPVAQLGDDVAAALGLRIEATRVLMLAVGVGCVAMATAFTGPISFVALAAPQLAAQVTRGGGLRLAPSAAMGAAILAASDAAAQHLLPGQLPVGVITWGIGGAYLVWLLIRQSG